MKIVYISNKPIFPLIDGGCIAMNQFLKCLLKAGYDVKHFAVSTDKHPFSEEKYPEHLQSIIRPEGIYIDTKIKVPDAISHLFKKGSYNIDRFNSIDFRDHLKLYLSEHEPDLIILESVYLAAHIHDFRKVSSAKILIRSHNVEFQIWERLAKNHPSFLKCLYYKKLAKDLKKAEIQLLSQADGLACITKDDQTIFKKSGITVQMTTIPVAIDKIDKQSDYSQNTFFHLGSMNWNPNIEAVRWLVTSIFPKIRSQLPDAKLYLGGSYMPKEFKSDASKGIEVLGYVENAAEFMTTHGIMLAPLKSGSGVRIKLLEGMNLGVPTVTSITGAEGINGVNEHDFFVAENETSFVKYAVKLAQSETERQEIGLNGKKLVEEHYHTESVTQHLIEFINYIS